jgi:hypothetical protein
MKKNERTHVCTRLRRARRHWSEATFGWNAYDRESAAADFPEVGRSLLQAAYACGYEAASDDQPAPRAA